ncbi:MAG: AmmeMemoRadiSam system protein B [Gemmataceae bacterium]|nr:AmmeMemoRadiSam system protein B [Gemmataceae bacterium]
MTAQHPESLALSEQQRQEILRAASQMIWDAVGGQATTPLTGEIAGLVVSGAFVSLKRGKHLRGCCGGLQPQPAALGSLLADAVRRTVFEDPRFPPVSSTELPYLDVEVWLLFNPCRVADSGAERAAAVVTGGKHGVVIRWGEQRGLLLPGVAAEHGWDSETLLDHVCQKAGLHPSRWREDDVHLTTFEGVSDRAPLGGEPPPSDWRFLSPEQVAAYAEFCRANLEALLAGGTPRYAAPGLPDATVNGLVVSLPWPDPTQGRGETCLQSSKIDLHRGMALQASLFETTRRLGELLAGRDIAADDLRRLGLTILYDPALQGSVHDPDLRGVDARRRALLIMERGRTSLLFDAQEEPERTLRAAAAELPVKDPASAAVFSLAADTSEPRVAHVYRPRASFGADVRPAAMADRFYPADPQALFALVDVSLGPEQPRSAWPAAMVPHAGLRFSGKVAGAVFRRLIIPGTVIVIGPKHTPYGMDWTVAPCRHWDIPGARLAADPELARRLADAIPGLTLDATAHAQEHAIEVELPFLARLAPKTKVVGIALGAAGYDECREFAEGLASVLRTLPEAPLLLISSDMNHFASDAATRLLDDEALGCLDRLDPEGLYETCRRKHISMCGVIPAAIVLETLRRLDRLHDAERVAYATSADTTGDPSRVVGYAGMVFGG